MPLLLTGKNTYFILFNLLLKGEGNLLNPKKNPGSKDEN